MLLYLYLINNLLLQTVSAVSRLSIANAATILTADISIYIYLVRRLTILTVVLIRYNF